MSGFSKGVIDERASHILSEIEANAPTKERYSLLVKVVNGGVALLVYAKDDGVARKVTDVQTSWTSCGPFYMGNKGAVGARFRVADEGSDTGETFTCILPPIFVRSTILTKYVFSFICAHLTAHEPKLADRIWDYNHIVTGLLFPPLPSSESKTPSTIYDTSHLFFLGDLNFRLSVPETHEISKLLKQPEVSTTLSSESNRESLKEFDQLLAERRKGTIFIGMREGEFWKFKCSYKYLLGEVDKYRYILFLRTTIPCALLTWLSLSAQRTPSWTDRILYTTHTDSPDTPDESNITNLLYTSIPSYTTSDHVSPLPNDLTKSAHCSLSETHCLTAPTSPAQTYNQHPHHPPSTSLQANGRSTRQSEAILRSCLRPNSGDFVVHIHPPGCRFGVSWHILVFHRAGILGQVEAGVVYARSEEFCVVGAYA